MSETRFLESNALLAVQADDIPEALDILENQMLSGERKRLRQAALRLVQLIENVEAQIGHLR